MSSQISIHALLAESDVKAYRQPAYHTEFLSTLSLRRATGENKKIKVIRIFLSTLSLRRATLIFAARHPAIRVFLSTLSLRRATPGRAPLSRVIVISIHALLAESDCQWRRSIKLFRQFLSTLSLRRATDQNWASSSGPLFLSTLSLRRATRNRFAVVDVLPISIHALLAESDAMPPATAPTAVYFYPRSPCGERPSRGRNRKN